LRIYVGNLPYEYAEEELKQAFIAYGQVETATVIRDRDSGRSKGFGFVEMPQAAEAKAAIEALNGKQVNSRNLTVNEARPREQRATGSGVGFGGGRRDRY
jgi:RNA recognition motif-containing protein